MEAEETLAAGPRLTEPKIFKYERPETDDPRALRWMAKSDVVVSLVQVIKEGIGNRLHSHADMDGFWFVLSGRAHFYGEGGVLIADLGANEGILMPRGCKYWFQGASEEPLELLQVSAIAQPKPTPASITSAR